MPTDAHEQNRLSWNAATERHNLHKGDQAKFLREGGSTIYPEDRDAIGDARGKSLLHLQCNCGQDSLSIARELGAEVTGVDISDHAIGFARRLSSDSGIRATFERCDIFDFCEREPAPQFDIVYTSYGTTGWLSDLPRWGRAVGRALKPGGRFAMVEFHPAFFMLDEDDRSRVKYDYMGGTHIHEPDGVGDYVGESGDGLTLGSPALPGLTDFDNPHPANAYCWGLADHFNALVGAGLAVESFREFGYSNGWRPYPAMRDIGGNRKAAPEGEPVMPLMFSMTANKPQGA